MPAPDYVVSGAYDPSGPGVVRNEWRKWVSANDWLYVAWRAFRWVVIHPKTWPGIALSYLMLRWGASPWLAVLPLFEEPIRTADKSQMRVLGLALQSRILTLTSSQARGTEHNVLLSWFRVRRGWATGAKAAGLVQSGKGGAVPKLHHWEVTNAGISAWVACGKFGWPGEDLQKVGPDLGCGIKKCRTVRVTPGQFLGDAQVYFNFADPLRSEIPITRLPVPPRGKLCIGFDEQGEPLYVWKHLPILLAGLQGSGKTNEIGTLVTSQLQSGEPVELWIADPNEGVDLSEFGEGSPIVREYALDRAGIRRMVIDLYDAMHDRMKAMRGREKMHTPTLAAPRWYLIIDEMLKWHNALQGKEAVYEGTGKGRKKVADLDLEAMFQEIMASQRRCAITTIANTQIPFDHAIGKGIGQLFPQKLVFRISGKWVTASMFGGGTEDLAPASKIEAKYPGIGYAMNEEETELTRFRGAFMTRGILRLIANGILPDGVATTEEQQAERDNRPQVIYRWDTPPEGVEMPDGTTYVGLLYIGISISAFDRALQHLSNPDKEVFNNVGVMNTVVVKLTAESCAEQLGQGRTVRQVAEETEKTLIQTLHPKLNIAHNGARPRDRKAIGV